MRLWFISTIQYVSLLKLVDLYQLQLPVNKYVLSFLKDLLPSSLKHIFTLSQNEHGHNTRYSTACKLMVQKTRTMSACHSIIQMDPQTWILLQNDIDMFIIHILCEFLIQIQTIHIEGP